MRKPRKGTRPARDGEKQSRFMVRLPNGVKMVYRCISDYGGVLIYTSQKKKRQVGSGATAAC